MTRELDNLVEEVRRLSTQYTTWRVLVDPGPGAVRVDIRPDDALGEVEYGSEDGGGRMIMERTLSGQGAVDALRRMEQEGGSWIGPEGIKILDRKSRTLCRLFDNGQAGAIVARRVPEYVREATVPLPVPETPDARPARVRLSYEDKAAGLLRVDVGLAELYGRDLDPGASWRSVAPVTRWVRSMARSAAPARKNPLGLAVARSALLRTLAQVEMPEGRTLDVEVTEPRVTVRAPGRPALYLTESSTGRGARLSLTLSEDGEHPDVRGATVRPCSREGLEKALLAWVHGDDSHEAVAHLLGV